MTQLELFPKSTEPTSKQHIAILNYLRQGFRMTGLTGLEVANSMKISTRIGELRKMGWNIKEQWVKTATGKRVMEYWI